MPTPPIPTEKARLLRLLRKTASVYLLLQCTLDPLGETAIAAALEMDRQTVRNHLRSLQAIGLVDRLAPRQGWILTQEARELFYTINPVDVLSTDDEPPTDPPPSSPPNHSRPPLHPPANGRDRLMADFPPNIAKATATAVNKLTIPPKSSAAVAQQEPQIARNTRSESDRPKSDRDALRDAGIFEPTASSLAKMPHVTADYVTAHALRARGEGATTGLLIHRMRCGDPSPELNRRGHLAGCKCDECQRDRYRLYMPEQGEFEPEPHPSPLGSGVGGFEPDSHPSPLGRGVGGEGTPTELQYA